MPRYCLKQCRDDERPFRASDAARVARYAAKKDGNIRVAARILQELELKAPICKLFGLFDALDRLEDAGGLAKAAGALATVVGGIIKLLKGVPKLGWLFIALGTLQLFLTGLKEILDELPQLLKARELARELCKNE